MTTTPAFTLLVSSGAFACTALCLLVVLKSPLHRRFADGIEKPQALHSFPVPRLGGLAITFGLALALVAAAMFQPLDQTLALLLLLGFSLVLLSVLDDLRGLPVLLRLSGHFFFAVLALSLLVFAAFAMPLSTSPAYLWLTSVGGVIALLLTIVWVTNLFNFVDGANGMLGFATAIGFASFALVASESNGIASASLAIVCACLTGAIVGFLIFNFPVARVFSGDAGSIPLGFLAATLAVYGCLIGAWHYWFPILVFSPVIADATLTIGKRTLAGHRPWQAHRGHYYQRLILSGWSHARTSLAYAAAALIASGIGFALMQQSRHQTAPQQVNGLVVLCIAVVTYVAIAGVLERRLRQKMNDPSTQEKRNQGLK